MNAVRDFTVALRQLPLVAILRGVRPEEAVAIGTAVVAAGFRVVEVPLNSPDPCASIARLQAAIGEAALVGAGTVLDPASVDDVAAAGGRLVVAPNFSPAVVARARGLGLATAPGVLTPSECFAALAAGADALKLFPGEIARPPVVKALRAVLPRTAPLLVVGGVAAENMADYVHAGATGFGIGSALYVPGLSAAEAGTRAAAIVAAARAAGLGTSP
jgi:2-dehydro-3-deoxyphosphogalactonate aldolase